MFGLRRLFAFLTVALVSNVSDGRPPKKIVQGAMAVPGEFPYQVSIRLNNQHVCGGCILSERHVLTAAHCFAQLVNKPHLQVRVVTGSSLISGGKVHEISNITIDAQYQWHDHSSPHDIAIVKLKDPLVFDLLQSSVKLPTSDIEGEVDATIVGWGLEQWPGRTPAPNLMKINLQTHNYTVCQKHTKYTLHPSQLCTLAVAGRGVCVGDSGGPLVHNGTLIGIVSYGVPCGRGLPDVYTNVFYFLDWIKRTMA